MIAYTSAVDDYGYHGSLNTVAGSDSSALGANAALGDAARGHLCSSQVIPGVGETGQQVYGPTARPAARKPSGVAVGPTNWIHNLHNFAGVARWCCD